MIFRQQAHRRAEMGVLCFGLFKVVLVVCFIIFILSLLVLSFILGRARDEL